MQRRTMIAAGLTALILTGCSSSWSVDYDAGLDPAVTRGWRLDDVIVSVPETLSVSNANSYIPSADIVWHGEPFGDRRAQVAAILDEGLTAGAAELKGDRPVTLVARLTQFHAVTPASVARAPSAVHNIKYVIQVLDSRTGAELTAPQAVSADLEAYVGAAAVAAAINGDTQRNRIVAHIAAVTRGWLGFGPDQRRRFSSLGR